MSTKRAEIKSPERKSLVQLQSESKVRDPAAHAKLQVAELDKTAKRSQLKRKECKELIESDIIEIAKLDEQINRMKEKYDPLCENLKKAKERKQELQQTLEQCLIDQKNIMGFTKNVFQERRIEDSKITRKLVSEEMEMLRGYTLKPESTFHQTGSHAMTMRTDNYNKSTTSLSKSNTMSMKTLPPIGSNINNNKMPRNNSSTL